MAEARTTNSVHLELERPPEVRNCVRRAAQKVLPWRMAGAAGEAGQPSSIYQPSYLQLLVLHRSTLRRRNALVITETDDRLIAAAAIIGDRRRPVIG